MEVTHYDDAEIDPFTEKAQPSYSNGVLTITVPKQEAKKARRLEIKTG